jgi:ribosomal protein S18 acetylase RimI-like enzyme
MMPSSAVLIREMSIADIPAGLSLCRASGWNQTERDWRYFLSTAPHGALAAVNNGQVIGTVATLPYGPFSWISMVLVDPAARRKGLGTLLLNRGLELIPEYVAARLDATPAGELLYSKLGFVAEYGVTRWFVDEKRRGKAHATGVRRLTLADWPAIHEMDAHVFGASRATLLKRLAEEAPEYAWVAELDGRVQGYLLGRHGHLRDHLGPLVAETTYAAERLLDACLRTHRERSLFLDAPDDQRSWSAMLVERGFGIERPFLRMHRGPLTARGQPSQVYAITGPEFG